MNKYIFILFFLVMKPMLATETKIPQNKANSIFIFTLNLDECIPCLNNAYLMAEFLVKNNISKEKIIFVIREGRVAVERKYEEDLSHILESKKISILWSNKLYKALQIGENKSGKVSELIIFDKKTNQFIFKAPSVKLNSELLFPYIKAEKNFY